MTLSTPGSEFAELNRLVRASGLLRRRRVAAVSLILVTLLLFAGTVAAVTLVGNSWWQAVVALVAGIVFTQVAFLGHDGGHQQMFRSRRANDAVGRIAGNLLTGLSYGWWVDKHNRHHANPNTEDADPDIGDGVLAFTAEQAATRAGRLRRAITRRQAWLFFPLLTLEGLNLHVASVRSLAPGAGRSRRGGARRSEALLLAAHAVIYLTGLFLVMSPVKVLMFVVIHQAMFGLYMGCSFAPNHKGMPTLSADEIVGYLRRQVLTSRNVRGGPFTDWALGGLNYQIEHHLFPNMPRGALRHAQPLVREFCAARGISYCETSLFGSYRAALTHLNALGAPLRSEGSPDVAVSAVVS